jgi:hypothetical protein
MPRPDANYDYTQDDVYAADQASRNPTAAEAEDFVMTAPDAEFTKSVEEIEAANGFREIPVGEHEVIIVGNSPPKTKRKDAFVGGRRASYTVFTTLIKFALPDDPGATVSDYFELPPSVASEHPAYFHGTKSADGKGKPGFMADKLYTFLGKIGFPVIKGRRLPDECLRLANWRGRRVILTVEPGEPYTDQTTGETKAGRPGVKLYSYKPAGSATPGHASAPASHSPASPKPSQSGPALRGLDNI